MKTPQRAPSAHPCCAPRFATAKPSSSLIRMLVCPKRSAREPACEVLKLTSVGVLPVVARLEIAVERWIASLSGSRLGLGVRRMHRHHLECV